MNTPGDASAVGFTALKTQSARWRLQAFGLLFLFIVISYSNSLTADWQLDDIPNIVENEKLHLNSLNLQALAQVFSAHPLGTGQMFRPIASLSFACNWYFGADNPLGYHIINILIHWGTAALLYLTLIRLLEAPAIRPRSESAKHLAAFLATFLWALNPVQTQAVTYIVQRMALLATFFCLASLLCYIQGRHAEKGRGMILWFLAALVCFGLALGSKENSIILPIALLLVEFIFSQSLAGLKKQHIFAAVGLLCLTAFAVYLLTNGSPLGSISGYEHRSFTLRQRLLTESRIIVFYLSQLFLPLPHRLSLVHDITLSTSFLQPLSTLSSIAFLFVLSAWSLWKRKAYPLVAFAFLFFLLNHLIESSIFPLELIFEHRNYLPSLFLFLPIAVLLVDALKDDRLNRLPILRNALIGMVLIGMCFLPACTYIRNTAWHTQQSLWEDSLAKAPGQSRSYINLAVAYQKQGKNDEAFKLCRQSLGKISPTPAKDRMRAYNNMGNIVMDKGEYGEAIGYYRQALNEKENPASRYFLHKALLANGQIDDAENELEALMRDNPSDTHLMTSMAIILTVKHEFPQAITLLKMAMKNASNSMYEQRDIQLCLGSTLSRQGDYTGADQQFRKVLSYSEPLIPLLYVIGNHIRQNNQEAATEQLKELYKYFPTEVLLKNIQSSTGQNVLFPVEAAILSDFIHSSAKPEPVSNTLKQ
jgi:protein O-mannosyl-transferase